jgi:hypothetical protein
MSARPKILANSSLSSVGWKCKACGRCIRRIEDGWVEWLASEEENGRAVNRGIQVVHCRAAGSISSGCRYDANIEFRRDKSVVEGLSLERFMGPDGLMLLMSLIASGEAAAGDVIEVAKRVQIPGYEQARDSFQLAIDCGLLSPAIGNGFYLQSEIRAVLRWLPGVGRT